MKEGQVVLTVPGDDGPKSYTVDRRDLARAMTFRSNEARERMYRPGEEMDGRRSADKKAADDAIGLMLMDRDLDVRLG